MTKKKHILTEARNLDFGLIGIASRENDYRMLWLLNQSLDFFFTRQPNLAVPDPVTKESLEFSCSSWYDENRKVNFVLLSNRTQNAFLLPEFRNFDYILKIEGDSDSESLQDLLRRIRQCEGVFACYELEVSKLKNPGRLEF